MTDDTTIETSGNKTRTQINVRMTPRHRAMLQRLGEDYGTESGAMKTAIEFLYAFTYPEALALAATAFEAVTENSDPLGEDGEDGEDGEGEDSN